MELTKKIICALRLPEGKTDVEFWDEKLRGFGVRVRPGSSNFFYYYRLGTAKHRMMLGPATVETVDAVRQQVGKLIARAPPTGLAALRCTRPGLCKGLRCLRRGKSN